MKCRCCDCAHLSEDIDYCDLTGLEVKIFGKRECACFIKREDYENHCCVNCNYYKEKCCSMIGQKVLDPNAPHSCGAFVNKTERVHVPCYVAVRRFYKCWIEVDANAERPEIESKMKQAILDDPENELIEEDPDIDLESSDICVTQIDWDGIQPCDEDESEDEKE